MTQQIEIELKRSLEGTGRYASASSGRGIGGASVASSRPEPGRHAGGDAGRTGLLYPELSYAIVGAAIEVHRWLGPGGLESTYQRAFQKELELREIPFRAQVPVPLVYKGLDIGDLFVDLVVDDAIVLELKAVSALLPVHRAQLMSYLRATRCRLGMLVNFHVPVMIQGIKRIAL